MFFITLYLIFVHVVLAEIIKRTSAFDGRASSTGLGCVGVSVIVAVMAFVVILDCGQRQKLDEKKKESDMFITSAIIKKISEAGAK